jgi:heat shock protein HslJ
VSGRDPVPFEGTPWVLASGAEVDGWEEFAPTARFEGGTASGSTGCNRYTGPYTLDGDTLELGAIASTRMACAPRADAVEREFLAALERVDHWRFDADGLVLLDDGNAELLHFAVATPVTDEAEHR